MKLNELIVSKVIDALRAETYKVRLVHTDNLKSMVNKNFPNKLFIISPDGLLKLVGYLATENMKGYNIYFRPQGYEYILLDDIAGEQLTSIAEIKPSLLIETSEKNYQVWLRVRNAPTDKEQAKELCRELATKYKADLGSADPEHVGRLPSYTNRKPQYKQANGQPPFVKLHKSEHRYSTYIFTLGGGVLKEVLKPAVENKAQNPPMLKENKEKEKKENTTIDRSRYDFNNVCMWLRQRKSYTDIYNLLNSSSDKAQSRVGENREKYLSNTIKNAIQRTGIQPKP